MRELLDAAEWADKIYMGGWVDGGRSYLQIG